MLCGFVLCIIQAGKFEPPGGKPGLNALLCYIIYHEVL